MPLDRDSYSISELAARYGTRPGTIFRLIYEGKLWVDDEGRVPRAAVIGLREKPAAGNVPAH